MRWKVAIKCTEEGGRMAIVNSRDEVVIYVDNLDSTYVSKIIYAHDEALDLARQEGVEIAKSVYNCK